jgi:hypothetical protein
MHHASEATAGTSHADPCGSVWRRWDPHLHAPGTALNNQFGADAWEEYLRIIEESEPRIEALGVTDYYSIDDYEMVVDHKQAGRLPDVGLIFPNVELRCLQRPRAITRSTSACSYRPKTRTTLKKRGDSYGPLPLSSSGVPLTPRKASSML